MGPAVLQIFRSRSRTWSSRDTSSATEIPPVAHVPRRSLYSIDQVNCHNYISKVVNFVKINTIRTRTDGNHYIKRFKNVYSFYFKFRQKYYNVA